MFENILGHEKIISDLKTGAEKGRLPGAMLFYGEPYGGKLTTALELARVLSCGNGGGWGCGCISCRRHRLLESNNILLLSSRKFSEEIAACADTLARDGGKAAKYLFYRAVKKLIRQFDSIQWQNNDQLLKKAAPDLEKINENLAEIHPEETSESPDPEIMSAILDSSVKIEKLIKSDGIPVFRIRNMTSWVHTTDNARAKIVIIDGADNMGEGSRNALLKVLEEPPERVFFILTSSGKEGIIPTILSRLRLYHFPNRMEEVQKTVLKRIFRITGEPFSTLKDYFYHINGIDLRVLREYSEEIIRSVISGERMDPAEFEEMIKLISDEKYFTPFIEEMTSLFSDIINQKIPEFKEISPEVISSWTANLNELVINRNMYNQSILLLLTSYIYSIRRGAAAAV